MSVSDNHRPRVVLASRKSSAMSNLKPTTGLVEFAGTAPAVGEAKAVSASRDALFVIPRGRGDGFRASVAICSS